jgi:response regulator of citrate/malate metabolism
MNWQLTFRNVTQIIQECQPLSIISQLFTNKVNLRKTKEKKKMDWFILQSLLKKRIKYCGTHLILSTEKFLSQSRPEFFFLV